LHYSVALQSKAMPPNSDKISPSYGCAGSNRNAAISSDVPCQIVLTALAEASQSTQPVKGLGLPFYRSEQLERGSRLSAELAGWPPTFEVDFVQRLERKR